MQTHNKSVFAKGGSTKPLVRYLCNDPLVYGKSSVARGYSRGQGKRAEATTRIAGFRERFQKTTAKPDIKVRRPKAARAGKD